jgi:peptidoglycan/xylan/chitin deacetylase (PgdA/CDA1 family)/glycosyltransferase involved in cell wall biosynthesis
VNGVASATIGAKDNLAQGGGHVNILHVLSQQEVTGAETYAEALIAEQVRAGHRAFVVSDTLHTPVEAEYLPMPIGKRDYPQRLRNVAALRHLIRARNIHLVHAHSRAASWVAFFATRPGRVPLVSTLHGLQPPHWSARAFSVYGEQILTISRSIQDNAIRDLGLPEERVHLVPNGVDLQRFHPGASRHEARRGLGLPLEGVVIALVGRLSGPRGPVARLVVSDVLPLVRASVPTVRLVIAGGMKLPEDFASVVAEANRLSGAPLVQHVGHQTDLARPLAAADVVIAAGRSAIEALATGRPVVALGEAHYLGVVSEETALEARDSNFGDGGIREPADAARVAPDVVGLLGDPGRQRHLAEWGRAFVQLHFDARTTWRRVAAAYLRARALKARPRRFPVVMYHRVVDAASAGGRHGIWVTRDRFADELASLARRGCTPITFRDYAAHLAGERALPRRPVILTFDDGYADTHTLAFPLLRQHGMTAVVFLIGDASIVSNVWDAAGEPAVPLLSREQIREMAACGIEFGSHTATHARLPDLDAEHLAAELAGWKRTLEDRVGEPVIALCYPYGAVNAKVKEAVAEAGYVFGVASDSGPLRLGEDLYEIRRAQVFPRTGRFGFWKKTSLWYLAYRRLARAAGAAPKLSITTFM